MQRNFEDAEFKLNETLDDIADIAREFFKTHPEICKTIRNARSNMHDLRGDTEPTAEGDLELIHAYGQFFELVGQQLQQL